jgi:four helix bundle protein
MATTIQKTSGRGYRDLVAWQKAMDLARRVYRLTENFPKSETFGLRLQLRRACVSIPSNIAEGNARFSKKDFVHFLRTSKGSLAELETQIMLAADFGYVAAADAALVLKQAEEVGRIMSGLIASLQ